MGREAGGELGMGNTCKSMADSCQWQKPLQYCKVISLQLLKINGKKNKLEREKQILYISAYVWNLEKWYYFGTKMV